MLAQSIEGSHRPSSPDTSGVGERKRKRKTLACYDCRRRKLKCDRTYPACSRCVKAGTADKCTYDSAPGSMRESNSPSPEGPCCNQTTDPMAATLHIYAPKSFAKVTSKRGAAENGTKPAMRGGKVEQLEDRVARLEAMSSVASPGSPNLPILSPNGPATGPDVVPDITKRHPRDVEMMFFKGGGFTTQFYGASNPTSMISQFPELRSFMKDAITQYTTLARVQTDLKALNVRMKSENPSHMNPQDAVLLSMIPEKGITDGLVEIYFSTLERLYRVLHIPSFWATYKSFWEAPQKVKPSFVVILLLVMASVSSLVNDAERTFIGRSSQCRETAIRWIRGCETWLARQSRKNVSVAEFQIRCLVDIAKHMNMIKKKRAWETAGLLLKIGMGAGLHRDPVLLGGSKVSFFDQEMRRRIWTTMVEWDLQASISRGMAPSSAAFSYDCAAPLNLDDTSFSESTVLAPTPNPFQQLSDTSFLHLAARSLPLRISLASLVNDPPSHIEYDEVLRYEEKIIQQIDALPAWQDDVDMPNQTKGLCLLELVLLEVQLRQFLIWLHFPFASRAGSDSRYNYSRTACFNSASIIIDQHSRLMELGNYTLCLLRNDGYLAALSICHNVFASSLHPSNVMFPSLKTSFSPVVERGLRMLEEKVMRLGEARNHYWFISASYSFVQAKVLPEASATAKHQAIDRVTRLFYRILAAQQEDYQGGNNSNSNNNNNTAPSSSVLTETTGLTLDSSGGVPSSSSSLNANNNNSNSASLVTDLTSSASYPTAQEQQQQQQQLQPQQDFDPFEYIDGTEWALDNLWPVDPVDSWY